jgi:hypothetical protein
MAVSEARDVMLRITSLQQDERGQTEKISLETPGRFGMRNQVPFLTYEETELTGMKGTRTTLFLYPESVALIRTGTYMQKQEYREGEETGSVCETPMGMLELSVKTERIENTVQDGAGRLAIAYEVELKGLFRHRNEIVVDVWEEKGVHGSQRGTEAGH